MTTKFVAVAMVILWIAAGYTTLGCVSAAAKGLDAIADNLAAAAANERLCG